MGEGGGAVEGFGEPVLALAEAVWGTIDDIEF